MRELLLMILISSFTLAQSPQFVDPTKFNLNSLYQKRKLASWIRFNVKPLNNTQRVQEALDGELKAFKVLYANRHNRYMKKVIRIMYRSNKYHRRDIPQYREMLIRLSEENNLQYHL